MMHSDVKKIVITGASGFLGRHLCKQFVELGYHVRAIYRRAQAPDELMQLSTRGLELVNLNLQLPSAADSVCQGMDIVLHSAALAYDWGPYDLYKQANIDVTEMLLDSAERMGCQDFIFISSAAVHGFGPHEDTTEDGPFYPLHYPYPITKLIAEKSVLTRNRPGFRTVAIRPCNVYGPGDVTSTYTMYQTILSGSFGYIGSGKAYTCPIYIDDLCKGVQLVVESDKLGGEAIILSDGTKVSWRDYTKTMFEAIGSLKKPVSLPRPLAFTAAGVLTLGAYLIHSKKAPPLTKYRVEQGSTNYHFSNEKAKRVLGFSPKVFYQEGLKRTAEAFLRDQKPIHRKSGQL
jgi:nucleoside-diphosphate-sugar epimerase